mmetsp:Transcript_9382/g.34776  ORF Transcript_9382/g.34776 Transcript_9382/m.34776 type:complete len:93 (+) Transcript_9382:2086-2364(+)
MERCSCLPMTLQISHHIIQLYHDQCLIQERHPALHHLILEVREGDLRQLYNPSQCALGDRPLQWDFEVLLRKGQVLREILQEDPVNLEIEWK